MSQCKGCGKEICWGMTGDGKRIPLDPKPPIYKTQAPATNGFMIVERAYEHMVSHFATCPNANDFSASRK